MKKIAINIGVAVLDDDHYEPGWTIMNSSINDADDMDILFETFDITRLKVLLDSEATREAVLLQLDEATVGFKEEDLLIFYFSGHGATFTDNSGKTVQAMCLNDWMLREDELWFELSKRITKFTPRIVFIADCCKSGGLMEAESLAKGFLPKDNDVSKGIPNKVAEKTHKRWRIYDERWSEFHDRPPPENLSIIALLACGEKDDAWALWGEFGYFTKSLLKCYEANNEFESYSDLMTKIKAMLPTLKPENEQTPRIENRGRCISSFFNEKPFN